MAGGRAIGRRIGILVAGQTLPEIGRRRGPFECFIRAQAKDARPALAARPRAAHAGPQACPAHPGWQWRAFDVRGGAPLPSPRAADAFVMTGSSSSVTERAPWMLRAEELLRQIVAARVPFLGVCFGHQMIAQALGGEVGRNPSGREIGTVRLTRVADDPALFAGLPRAFDVHATHVDTVTRLPPGAEVLARTALEPTAAFRIGDLVHGVQFHPEFDADIMRGYLVARAALVRDEGGNPDALLAAVHDGARGGDVLRNFLRHIA